MNSAICTVFEGNYHYGVAALSNSLNKNGFQGNIYVGYRGSLPLWVLKGKKEKIGKWKDAITVSLDDAIQIVFLEVETSYSLTNYKPDFMLEIWQGPAKNAEALFYFDPDIVVIDSWACFEQWVHCGVAVCEDVNSPLQEFHPRRQGWRNYYKNYNIDLQFKNQIYANGGFVGLLKKDIDFLTLWIRLQENMGEVIGGLKNSIFSNQTYNSTILKMDGFQIFDKSDQDALNATIEAYIGPISFIGKEGMGFVSGRITMYHALGANKPWEINYLRSALNGRSPRDLDSTYWNNSISPILAHTRWKIRQKQIAIKLSKFIGRFYKV